MQPSRNRSGGGVNFEIRSDLNQNGIEALTIEIHKYKRKPFLVSTLYRPPNSPIKLLTKFENFLQLIDIEEKESVILGDINCDLLHQDLDHKRKNLPIQATDR